MADEYDENQSSEEEAEGYDDSYEDDDYTDEYDNEEYTEDGDEYKEDDNGGNDDGDHADTVYVDAGCVRHGTVLTDCAELLSDAGFHDRVVEHA